MNPESCSREQSGKILRNTQSLIVSSEEKKNRKTLTEVIQDFMTYSASCQRNDRRYKSRLMEIHTKSMLVQSQCLAQLSIFCH